MFPNPVVITVNRKNSGGGRQMKATKHPMMQPTAVLITTFTGMNHHSRKCLREMVGPRWVKIRQGRNKVKTRRLRTLRVGLGRSWNLGWVRRRPTRAMERSLESGRIELIMSSPMDLEVFR